MAADGSGAGAPVRVAIIGGGVAGAVCARTLVRLASTQQLPLAVSLFDQGSELGGRACQRRLSVDGTRVSAGAPDAAFAFDHGCQFFRADSPRMREELLAEWLERGWAEEWKGDFGTLHADGEGGRLPADFFGFPGRPPFFCSVGGMSALPCAVLAAAEAEGSSAGLVVSPGVRVAGLRQLSSGDWLLSGTSGRAALHDTPEEEAARASPDSLGEFQAVVVTDVSASMASWHRASAGLPEAVASKVRGRTRVCLFTALFAFEEPLEVQQDAFAAADDTLWFASRTRSKPGMASAVGLDCWTLISTPKYAAAEVERVPMQDPATGAFRPQEPSYIRDGPAADLLAAFERLLRVNGRGDALPRVLYTGGQRWGSAFPAPAGVGGRDGSGRGPETVEVLGVAYDSAPSLPLTSAATGAVEEDGGAGAEQPDSGSGGADFLADEELGIYYASDYVSSRLPGFEAAALSGLDVAHQILQRFSRAEKKTAP